MHSVPINNKQNIIGVILAGGKSSRMGRDKATLPYKEGRLIDHMAQLLKLKKIVVSGEVEGFDCIQDESKERGPIGGIYSVLKAVYHNQKNMFLLIIPVDMPYLNNSILEALLEKIADDQFDAVYYESNPLPLLLKCNHRVMTTVKSMLQNNSSASIKRLLKKLKTHCLSIETLNPEFFSNINRPSQWNNYIEHMKSEENFHEDTIKQ